MSKRKQRVHQKPQSVAPVSDSGRLNLPGVKPDLWDTIYGPSSKAAAVTALSVLGIPTYYRCLQILAALPSLLPARVIEGRGKDMKVIQDHHVADLWNWSFDGGSTSAYSDRCFIGDQKHRLGNAVGEILRNGRQEVRQIRWLQRNEVFLYRDEQKQKRFEFELGPGEWSDPVHPRRVFHLPNYAPDGFIGRSAIAMQRDLLETAILSADNRSEFFRKGGRPSGYLKKKDRIADPKFKDEMREEWRQASPNGLAILHNDTDYIPLSLPPEDAKFLEGMKWDAIQICQIMGVPPYMAGIAGKETDIMAEELAIHFVLNTLMPEVRAIESEASLKLFGNVLQGDPKYRLELDLSVVLLASLKSQAEFYGKMVGCGALVPDEVREQTGYAPHPDGIGSVPLIAGNNYTRLSGVVDGTVQNGATEPSPTSKPAVTSALAALDKTFSSLSEERKAALVIHMERMRGKTEEEIDRTLAS
jgi:HK97 family phage portal protein